MYASTHLNAITHNFYHLLLPDSIYNECGTVHSKHGILWVIMDNSLVWNIKIFKYHLVILFSFFPRYLKIETFSDLFLITYEDSK